MNKIIKHKFLAGVLLLGSMLAGSSCEDNVGINVTPETPFADKTLQILLQYFFFHCLGYICGLFRLLFAV